MDELIASDRLPVRISSRPDAVNCWPASDGDRKRVELELAARLYVNQPERSALLRNAAALR